VKRLSLCLLVGCAAQVPVVRGDRDYRVPASHYALELLPDGSAGMPGLRLDTAGNHRRDTDFSFTTYGQTQFAIVQGIALRDEETGLSIAELADSWRISLSFFALNYSNVATRATPTVSPATILGKLEGAPGDSAQFTFTITSPASAFAIYGVLLRDPARKRVVAVLYGNDPGGAFQAGEASARDLARRVRFDPP
jgi:hypothetical protein